MFSMAPQFYFYPLPLSLLYPCYLHPLLPSRCLSILLFFLCCTGRLIYSIFPSYLNLSQLYFLLFFINSSARIISAIFPWFLIVTSMIYLLLSRSFILISFPGSVHFEYPSYISPSPFDLFVIFLLISNALLSCIITFCC